MVLARFLTICLIILFFFIPQKTFAQKPTEENSQDSVIESNTVDYPLPYPGILPGEPFYFLKAVRDKILEITTLNPFKKTEFFLLQADKKLSSAIYFFDSNKKRESDEMLSQGLDFLEKAINEEEVAKNSPGNLMELSQKIIVSSKKQTEVSSSFFENSPDEERAKFGKEFSRAKDLEKLANEFRL